MRTWTNILAAAFVAMSAYSAHAVTQTKIVGTAATVANGDFDWSTPGNVTADDGIFNDLSSAMTTTTESSWFLDCTMSGNVFTIPAGATINGITVTMESQDNEAGPAVDSVILIIKSGTASGTDHKNGVGWPITLGTKVWGSTSDLWGLTWTVPDINATNFGIRIKCAGGVSGEALPAIDYVQISIDFTPLISAPPVLAPIGAKTVNGGANLNFVVTATDPDLTTPTLSAVDVPINATFVDNADGTGTFNFNPDFTQAGVFNVTFIASDGSLADSEVVAITVNNVNQAPVLAPIGPQSTTEHILLTFGVSA
ncbi:MAG: hypothetical protein IH914_03310, partial [candidate division Zixibacteria bacterium]|nr:hypothetical protein [candidate division Zixibacteria bacterium]